MKKKKKVRYVEKSIFENLAQIEVKSIEEAGRWGDTASYPAER